MATVCAYLPSLKCVLALFVQTTFVLGTIKSIGVYLPELEAALGITTTDIGVALGLFSGFAFGPGPVIAYLYQRYRGGYRRLLVTVGALLAPGGLIVASQVAGKVGLSLCLAAAGLGSNILSISLVIALNDQTTGSFGILYGIGKSGYAFGMSLVPLAADYLMMRYGWSGSLLIIGGIMANLIPLSLMVDLNASRGLKDHSKLSTTDAEDRNNDKDVLGDNKNDNGLYESDKNDKYELKMLNDDDDTPGNDVPFLAKERDHNDSKAAQEGRMNAEKETAHYYDPVNRDDSDSDGNWKRNSSLAEVTNQHTLCQNDCCKFYNSLIPRLKNSVYNRDRWLILLMLITFAFAMMDGGWHAFLVPRAVDRGWSSSKALHIAYSAAVAAFIGRCFGGVLIRYQLLSNRSWFVLLTLLNIAALLADILVSNFPLMLATSFVTSLTIAERNILVLVLCKDRVAHSEFAIILASSEIVFGVGAFIGVSLSGFMVDVFGTFNAAFIFIAAVDVVVFCFTVPLFICDRPIDVPKPDDEKC